MAMTITEKILAAHAGRQDVLEVNPSTGAIKNLTKDETYQAQPLPPFAQEIMAAGGLMNYVARKKGLVA